jgi:hypothetical protein
LKVESSEDKGQQADTVQYDNPDFVKEKVSVRIGPDPEKKIIPVPREKIHTVSLTEHSGTIKFIMNPAGGR